MAWTYRESDGNMHTTKRKGHTTMKNTENIRRTEEYTENTFCCYRRPNTSTMENLSMQVCAGEGAVLKMGDRVLVTDHAWKGFIAGGTEGLLVKLH